MTKQQDLRRFTSVILALTVFITVFAACGDKADENSDYSSGIASTADQIISSQTESSEISSEIESSEVSEESSEVSEESSEVSEENSEVSEESSEPEISIPIEDVEELLIDVRDLKLHDNELIAYGDVDMFDRDQVEFDNILYEIAKFEQTGENLSFAVWSSDGSKALTYNTNQVYFTACAIKIAYVYSCCKQIDEGLVDKNVKIAYEERHKHDGAGIVQNSPFGTEYTVEELLKLAVSISDNVAYEMIIEYFGHDYYHDLLKEINCESLRLRSQMWCHTALVTEFVAFWDILSDYFETDAPMAASLKEYCTNTTFNYGTLTLNEDVDYSHKSGDNSGDFPAYNDAGIVWAEVPYMYCIFTNTQGVDGNTKTTSAIMTEVHKIMGGNPRETEPVEE